MKRLLAALIVLAVLGAAGSLWLRYAGFAGEAFVDVPKGTSTRQLAALLAEEGVIRYSWQLLLVRALHPRVNLKAGEYRFAQPASVWEVFDRLGRGDVFFYELVVPEGNNLFDIAASLDRLGVQASGGFLPAARDVSSIRDLAPQVPTLEGFLFPDTYRVTRHMTAEQLCRQMTGRFRAAWEKLDAHTEAARLVVLASLVEKEARVPEERPLVASVYANRLKLGMPLQCDPTTIYAALLEDRYRGAIFRSDLASRNRYNTYQYAGLPPGPIANPGLDSLRAALHPAETEFLYFVARPDGSGRHTFSKTLAEHEKAVRTYRRGSQNPPNNPVARLDRREPAGADRGNRTRRAARASRAHR